MVLYGTKLIQIVSKRLNMFQMIPNGPNEHGGTLCILVGTKQYKRWLQGTTGLRGGVRLRSAESAGKPNNIYKIQETKIGLHFFPRIET